ncbi:MAG: acyl carrier protein [Gaiellaceae bacterium]
MTTLQTRLEAAIVRRVCVHLGHEPAPGEAIDHEASFFAADGFRLGDRELDSIDFVEMIVAIEDDLGVSILDAADVENIDSIQKLAAFAEASAATTRLNAFCEQWG